MSAADLPQALDEIAGLCAGARRILFITGAGISADSGLPTYRGIGGLYDRRLTDEGLAYEFNVRGMAPGLNTVTVDGGNIEASLR